MSEPSSPPAPAADLKAAIPSPVSVEVSVPSNPSSPIDKASVSTRGDRGNKNLTYTERRSMLEFLLQRRNEDTNKLARHAITDAAAEYRVDRRTVSRLWKRAVQSMENGDQVADIASRKVGHRGRRKRDWSAELERVKQIPLEQRGSIRALASAVGIPKTTLFELLREDGSPTRVINSIKPPLTDKNKDEVQRMITSNIMPAIREKMPEHMKGLPIFIQQDNAKVRSSVNDAAFTKEGQKDGWDIQMQSLPPYSPDFTVLDNTLFKTIQTSLKNLPPLALGTSVPVLNELLVGVNRAFELLTKDHINDAFLSLQKIMEYTMRVQGSNTYELGSTGKAQLEHEGSLPISILCHPDAMLACRAVLDGVTEEVL
ncbi:hypothetical protein BBJ29_006279 [Phytophthora kernoviae]|uniref:DUF7769 domain-containing protein n=1 Tax=Phytophthora kernoviae TaxID=325452 RepID=A0A3F2RQE2_9STRA|nr:hypothetical protein BBJ29_006279 [Phytophthora kernoviae]RLN61111.1 hypothetical protein BBP00_00005622 [Phytophthora kernoviae]